MTDGTAREPWQWEEAEWRARVNRVRAGRRLAPAAWPDGRGFAVAISFDSDHETNELRDGGNSISRFTAARPRLMRSSAWSRTSRPRAVSRRPHCRR